jgi:hypothetical protein
MINPAIERDGSGNFSTETSNPPKRLTGALQHEYDEAAAFF